MQHTRRTKIIATIGPASSSREMLMELKETGVDVFRINFSHGSQEEHAATIARINEIRKHKEVAILQDLPGPKIRFGPIEGGVRHISIGETVILSSEADIDKGELPVEYENFSALVNEGDEILIDDGVVKMRVVGVDGVRVSGEVLAGERITSFKGLNIPHIRLKESAFTPEDQEHLAFGIKHGVDIVAASFVGTAQDIKDIKEFLRKNGGETISVIAKIERHSALEHIEDILEIADGIMVARGDMGVQMNFEEVPFVQKDLIVKARNYAKPVITATHMLESMVHNPRPTRAEVADVAGAVLDGTDAVMLSAETAVGQYPKDAVHVIARVLREAESHLPVHRKEGVGPPLHASSAVAHSAVDIAEQLDVGAIFILTESGSTVRLVSRYRPRQRLYALTPNEHTLAHLKVNWGVEAFLIKGVKSIEEASRRVREVVKQYDVPVSDRFVLCAGIPFEVPGGTNMVFVDTIGQEGEG